MKMRMPVIRVLVIGSLILVVVGAFFYQKIKQEGDRFFSEDPSVWEEVIAEMERADEVNPPAQNAVLFVGSSSIRLWDSLSEDMLPLVAFGRGFGGAKIMDVSYYANRLVSPSQPKAVVVYVGGNDFSDIFQHKPKTLNQVKPLYGQLFDRLKAVSPHMVIFIVALKPTEQNWHQWPLLEQVNQFLMSVSEADPRVHYIDANVGLYDEQGLPNGDYLLIDGMHPSAEGYSVWGAAIRQRLLTVLESAN